jgi:hypothetical protein
MTKQEELVNSINVVSGELRSYDSILISTDDKYLYALKNDLDRNANDNFIKGFRQKLCPILLSVFL